MKIKIEIDKFHADFDPVPVHKFLRDVGAATRDKMVREAAAKKSGRVYDLGGGKTYQASAPGEFPANKHGNLSRSYRFQLEGTSVDIGTDVLVYPSYLRAGTIKMKPRKFLREGLEYALENTHMESPFTVWRRG